LEKEISKEEKLPVFLFLFPYFLMTNDSLLFFIIRILKEILSGRQFPVQENVF